MKNLIEWFRTRKLKNTNNETTQKIPGGIAQINIILRKGPAGSIIFKTRIIGEFKTDTENPTINAIQTLITQLEEETKTNHWSAVIKRPEIRP